MQNVRVTRYQNPKALGWAGYVEPDDLAWIMFIGLDGRPLVFLNRDPVTGAILGDDPTTHAADIAALRARTKKDGGHIGEKADGSADYAPGRDPHAIGERIHPLGIDGTGGIGVAA